MYLVDELKEQYDDNFVNKDFLSHRQYNTKKHANTVTDYLYYLFYTARGSAKFRKLPFNLTQLEVLKLYEQQHGLCAVTKVKMTYIKRKSRHKRINGTNISIDRINSSKGYTLDNIQLVCADINIMKLDHTPADFIKLCKEVANANSV